MVVSPPQADAFATASYIWTVIDNRIQAGIKAALDVWGKPRSRTLTINFPIAGAQAPSPGWIASVGISHDCKIVQWSMTALVPGQISLDLRVTTIQTSQATAVSPVSILGTNFIVMNGSTAFSSDTTSWLTNQISADSVLHVFANSASSISQAILVLRVIDTVSKTISH